MKNSQNIICTILKTIKEERLKQGLSQQQIGRSVGLSQNAYYKLENGTTRLDMLRYLIICEVLNINPRKLIC